jgi:hypothetical protein
MDLAQNLVMRRFDMATSVAELAQPIISRVENLQKEWETNQKRNAEIEAEMAKMCNGHSAKKVLAKATKRGRPKSDGNKVNKAEAIRQYHAEHKDARPKDIISALNEKGIEVSPAAVWQAINHVPTGKRGRPAKVKATKVAAKKRDRPAKAKSPESKSGGQGRRVPGTTLADYVLKVLGRNTNGLVLKDVVQKIVDAGYETKSKNLAIAINNCLAKLREKKTVVKDAESRCYTVKAG